MTQTPQLQRDLQRRAETEAPSAQLATSGPHVVEGERAPNGRWQEGNKGAWRHGLRSRRPLPVHQAALVQERINTIVADLGGPDALSAITLGQIKRHARLELADDDLWADLEESGMSTGKGHTRARTSLWLQVVDRLQKSSLLLGLDRRQKSVKDMSATEWLSTQGAPKGHDENRAGVPK